MPSQLSLRALAASLASDLSGNLANNLASEPGVTHENRDRLVSEAKRIAEAVLFAATRPLTLHEIAPSLPQGVDAASILHELRLEYEPRGIHLVRVDQHWMFRTALDLSGALGLANAEPKKLSRAALETLAIVAYHQPVTRAEIEEIRGVSMYRGTLDVLIEAGWVRLSGRRRAPGRPLTYGTTTQFLAHFGLDTIADLPNLAEMKGAGLFDGALPAGFQMATPRDDAALDPDEEPLEKDVEILNGELTLPEAENLEP